jgi:hypothetical protein
MPKPAQIWADHIALDGLDVDAVDAFVAADYRDEL